jgi:hypothetical protein
LDPADRPHHRAAEGGQGEPFQDPGFEPGRGVAGGQQFQQCPARYHQPADFLAAGLALVQVRERIGALMSGEGAERQFRSHVSQPGASYVPALIHNLHPRMQAPPQLVHAVPADVLSCRGYRACIACILENNYGARRETDWAAPSRTRRS